MISVPELVPNERYIEWLSLSGQEDVKVKVAFSAKPFVTLPTNYDRLSRYGL